MLELHKVTLMRYHVALMGYLLTYTDKLQTLKRYEKTL